jgi:hypothetical protein
MYRWQALDWELMVGLLLLLSQPIWFGLDHCLALLKKEPRRTLSGKMKPANME